jgi:hypothetical protein
VFIGIREAMMRNGALDFMGITLSSVDGRAMETLGNYRILIGC